MFTRVSSTGSVNGSPSCFRGGQVSLATPYRMKKYAVNSEANSMSSEPMKRIIARSAAFMWPFCLGTCPAVVAMP